MIKDFNLPVLIMIYSFYSYIMVYQNESKPNDYVYYKSFRKDKFDCILIYNSCEMIWVFNKIVLVILFGLVTVVISRVCAGQGCIVQVI